MDEWCEMIEADTLHKQTQDWDLQCNRLRGTMGVIRFWHGMDLLSYGAPEPLVAPSPSHEGIAEYWWYRPERR